MPPAALDVPVVTPQGPVTAAPPPPPPPAARPPPAGCAPPPPPPRPAGAGHVGVPVGVHPRWMIPTARFRSPMFWLMIWRSVPGSRLTCWICSLVM
ncbi:MAG: hypothetical protein EXR91_01910 [Gemmatimonadetes bacterium]|nr:hypothetical protein [Gemmatimonadota bacterium]